MARYTDGGGLDLTTIERNAWQAGDMRTADLAARLMDAESDLEGEEGRIDTAYDEGHKEGEEFVRERLQPALDDAGRALDNLRKVVRSAAGKEVLEDLDRALDAMQSTLDGR